MRDLCRLIWCGLIGFFRSRASLEAEILVLRHQLNVLRRKSSKRPHRSADICRSLWLGAEPAERLGDRQARNRNTFAPRGVSFVLAMEVKITRWSSEAARRN